jgi:hypothetical protein
MLFCSIGPWPNLRAKKFTTLLSRTVTPATSGIPSPSVSFAPPETAALRLVTCAVNASTCAVNVATSASNLAVLVLVGAVVVFLVGALLSDVAFVVVAIVVISSRNYNIT